MSSVDVSITHIWKNNLKDDQCPPVALVQSPRTGKWIAIVSSEWRMQMELKNVKDPKIIQRLDDAVWCKTETFKIKHNRFDYFYRLRHKTFGVQSSDLYGKVKELIWNLK